MTQSFVRLAILHEVDLCAEALARSAGEGPLRSLGLDKETR